MCVFTQEVDESDETKKGGGGKEKDVSMEMRELKIARLNYFLFLTQGGRPDPAGGRTT